jgi:predicted transcriptional regulator
MGDYIKVVEHKDLIRDSNSKAILSKDSDSLNKYKEDRELKRKLMEVAQNYDTLKNDVNDIKTMIQFLIERKS